MAGWLATTCAASSSRLLSDVAVSLLDQPVAPPDLLEPFWVVLPSDEGWPVLNAPAGRPACSDIVVRVDVVVQNQEARGKRHEAREWR